MADTPDDKKSAPSGQPEHPEEVSKQAAKLRDTQLSRPEEIRVGMMRTVITEPLLSKVVNSLSGEGDPGPFDVIISLNESYKGGIASALQEVEKLAREWNVPYSSVSNYCFARLTAKQLLDIAEFTRWQIDQGGRNGAVVYRVWEDNDVSVSLTRSLTTVKADAAQRAFQATGEGITWAVLDSGIQGDHPHFSASKSPFGPFRTLNVPDPVNHMDFTPLGRQENGQPSVGNATLVDRLGHGTHVAGIIAGYWESVSPEGDPVAGTELRNEAGKDPLRRRETVRIISGVAPRCRLVSMKVIADTTEVGDRRQTAGQGKVSWVLLAIEEIQKLNQYGKRLLIHGANMSLGYDFDPRWFACGQSPLCVEVNRLVKCGVSVVVSAGNSGYATFINGQDAPQTIFSDLSISDPGNADLAITVGSTHKEKPHTYGVSFFSSRGPTGDGRLKPDLIAPGERIISCAAGREKENYPKLTTKDDKGQEREVDLLYVEQSGTSMAAPHVSGAIAAFLSVRPEFTGQPEEVKEIFMANTIDLRRDRCFQGTGLLDLMKVLQAV